MITDDADKACVSSGACSAVCSCPPATDSSAVRTARGRSRFPVSPPSNTQKITRDKEYDCCITFITRTSSPSQSTDISTTTTVIAFYSGSATNESDVINQLTEGPRLSKTVDDL